MKPLIIGIIIVALVIAGIWGYARYKSTHSNPTPTPTVSGSVSPTQSPTGTPVIVFTPTPSVSKFPTPTPTNSPTGTPTSTPKPTVTTKPKPTPYSTRNAPIGNRVGDQMPNFQLQSLGRGPVSLSQYRGNRAVLIALWSSSCGACVNQFSQLASLQNSYGDGTIVLLINRAESYDTVSSYTQQFFGTRTMILLDPADTIHRLLGTNDLPYYVQISKEGVIQSIRSTP